MAMLPPYKPTKVPLPTDAFATNVGRDRAKGSTEGPSAPGVRLESAYGRCRTGRRHDEHLAVFGGSRWLSHE